MESLKERVLDIAHKHKLSHLGSYFSSLDVIEEIFENKCNDDIFILSAGHAAVALYAVIEKYHGICAEELFLKHGGHPYRDEKNKLYCSTGSLGLGLLVAIGRALGNKNKKVYCLISDGECAEGSIWEGLRYAYENKIENLKIYLNVNGFCAYDKVDVDYLTKRIIAFNPNVEVRYTTVEHFPFLRGLNAHYHVMTDDDYKLAKKMLERRRDFDEKVIC
jgi:transketolase